jgi:protein gp37
MGTGIEWTDETWNPVTGCDRVSPGCAHCYALALAARLKAMGNVRYQTDGAGQTSGPGFGVALHDDVVEHPLHWRKPRRIFVNSMSDLFHTEIPDAFIGRVFEIMAATPQHTYQVLTKRPERMRDWADQRKIAPNIWLGTSVENQYWAEIRVPLLLDTPASIRFLSCEPLLGALDLSAWVSRLNWVIVGGESGPGHRPMDPAWVRGLRAQTSAAGASFFFKQWGGANPKAGGRRLDGEEWSEMPVHRSDAISA